MFDHVIVTCEHAGNRVPDRYASLFAGKQRVLESHRGLDIGALAVARHLARALDAPLHASSVTRLLVELNRSPNSHDLFSEFARGLPRAERSRILARYYLPYRQRIEADICRCVGAGRSVFHLSVHSFTPVLHGETRRAELGLLYDPSRSRERKFARIWRRLLAEVAPEYRVRRNYPYTGLTDGFMPYLRKSLSTRLYVGVEIEMNQNLLRNNDQRREHYVATLLETLRLMLGKKRG